MESGSGGEVVVVGVVGVVMWVWGWGWGVVGERRPRIAALGANQGVEKESIRLHTLQPADRKTPLGSQADSFLARLLLAAPSDPPIFPPGTAAPHPLQHTLARPAPGPQRLGAPYAMPAATSAPSCPAPGCKVGCTPSSATCIKAPLPHRTPCTPRRALCQPFPLFHVRTLSQGLSHPVFHGRPRACTPLLSFSLLSGSGVHSLLPFLRPLHPTPSSPNLIALWFWILLELELERVTPSPPRSAVHALVLALLRWVLFSLGWYLQPPFSTPPSPLRPPGSAPP